MRLFEFLRDNKGDIQERWVNLVLDSYSEDAAAIFKREQDRFANPVGYSTRHTLTTLYSLLFDHDTPQFDQLRPALEDFIKIRAVQTFTPASAVAFVYDLKGVIRKAVSRDRAVEAGSVDWEQLHDTLDTVALQVFDLYMACRERLYKTQLNEYKSMNHMLTQHGCPAAGLADDTTKLMADVHPLNIHSNEAR
ncbi:RsbRD N-terminal domain-containing protein [Desulfurivibrio sp. D14AmB]|uniref:RsbRD N-terminal domain-containing protein n=1 Tax=Desulfurivibrio sp. D14AmB TaxID=3374370 RepID=UPI00376F13C4